MRFFAILLIGIILVSGCAANTTNGSQTVQKLPTGNMTKQYKELGFSLLKPEGFSESYQPLQGQLLFLPKVSLLFLDGTPFDHVKLSIVVFPLKNNVTLENVADTIRSLARQYTNLTMLSDVQGQLNNLTGRQISFTFNPVKANETILKGKTILQVDSILEHNNTAYIIERYAVSEGYDKDWAAMEASAKSFRLLQQ